MLQMHVFKVEQTVTRIVIRRTALGRMMEGAERGVRGALVSALVLGGFGLIEEVGRRTAGLPTEHLRLEWLLGVALAFGLIWGVAGAFWYTEWIIDSDLGAAGHSKVNRWFGRSAGSEIELDLLAVDHFELTVRSTGQLSTISMVYAEHVETLSSTRWGPIALNETWDALRVLLVDHRFETT
jgi:hypothetical protein